ncbi:Rap1a/Tai family immunity protein [Shewanella sp. Isolate11]|uniref:Rap1a/Tai family immunity protein n=1 Tax=Shewanella sp. Isolate11 TaxID=2908530 RepID=UPI001EFDDB7F|nr:Rap1a/Tai family immunity protein [Shewanella sp. Isolate11]MCG9697451.1 hypothetical protein [Shewanella sp. Isolate11]
MKMKYILIVLTLCFSFNVKAAEPSIFEQCKTLIQLLDGDASFGGGEKAIDAGICLGYVSGVAESLNFVNGINKGKKRYLPIACIPNNVSDDQLARIVVKHLKDNPRILHESRTFIVARALREAFPCY